MSRSECICDRIRYAQNWYFFVDRAVRTTLPFIIMTSPSLLLLPTSSTPLQCTHKTHTHTHSSKYARTAIRKGIKVKRRRRKQHPPPICHRLPNQAPPKPRPQKEFPIRSALSLPSPISRLPNPHPLPPLSIKSPSCLSSSLSTIQSAGTSNRWGPAPLHWSSSRA